MLISKEIDFKKGLTEKQIATLRELEASPAVPDEECPELTTEQLRQLAKASQMRREDRRKQTVTLRLSPQALTTAKSLGKGYTAVLSRILESALKDADVLRNFL